MADFFAMGGYGFYVWSSYGMTLLVLVVEVVVLSRRHGMLMQRLSRGVRVKAGVNQ